MPKEMNVDYKLNFSKTAQSRFDKFVNSGNWSWIGLALALIKRFGLTEIEKFHFVLGESIKNIKKDMS